jgi:hypothetical protein
MQYMEVPRPDGEGLCSDDTCPCGFPGARIPRGKGFVYISQEIVDFRKDCPTVAAAQLKIARMQQKLGTTIFAGSGVFAPILMCEQGAKKRGIDMTVAAEDARYWWETGLVPLRPTPLAGKHQASTVAKPDSVSHGGGCAIVLVMLASLIGSAAIVLAAYIR